MLIKNILVGAVAAGIAFASLDMGVAAAAAAPVMKSAHMHMLMCKKGWVAEKTKVHGKWHWHCVKAPHHPKHHRHHSKLMHPVMTKVTPASPAPTAAPTTPPAKTK